MGTMKTKTPEQIEAKRAADRAYQAKKRADAKAEAKTPLKLTGTPGPTAPLPRRESPLTDADITGMVRRSHLKEEKEAPAVKAPKAPKAPKGEPKRRGRAPKVELSTALTNEIVKRHRAGESFNDIAIDLDARGVEGILRVTKGRPKDVGGHVYSAFHKATGWKERKAWRGVLGA